LINLKTFLRVCNNQILTKVIENQYLSWNYFKKYNFLKLLNQGG